jgi:hypothetical protein
MRAERELPKIRVWEHCGQDARAPSKHLNGEHACELPLPSSKPTRISVILIL